MLISTNDVLNITEYCFLFVNVQLCKELLQELLIEFRNIKSLIWMIGFHFLLNIFTNFNEFLLETIIAGYLCHVF